ncbi:MAG: CIA30 family protein, partial [Myxococcota bacterium]
LTDFTDQTAELGWFVLNDNVMGGRSEGGFTIAGGTLSFRGRTNTNGGGFSSIRTGPLTLDVAKQQGIRLRVRGDGRRYTWRLSTDVQWRGRALGFWAVFDTRPGEWMSIELPFERFIPRFRGQVLDGPTLDPAKISGMGLMIYDGRDGAFTFELDRVSSYPARPPFSLDALRWNKRVLVLNTSSHLDERYSRQREELTSARSSSEERDIVVIELSNDGLSTLGERTLTRDEVSKIRAGLDLDATRFAFVLVGKDGSVKLRRDAVTPLRDVHALIDTMPMRQHEMSGK